MDQTLRTFHSRLTSEQLQRRIIYELVNRVNITLRYKKTSEERIRTKKVIADHKKAMLREYGTNYNRRKILNPSTIQYEITALT